MYCLSNSSAKVFSIGHTHSDVFLFFVFLSLVIAEAKCKYVLLNRVPDYFFCLFVDMHICTHTLTCKDICIRDSFYPHTIQFMHSSPTEIPPDAIAANTHPPQNPHYNTPLLYIMAICIAHTLSKKKIKKEKEITNIF